MTVGLSRAHFFVGASIASEPVWLACGCGCGTMSLALARYLDVCPLPFLVLRFRLRLRGLGGPQL